MDQLMIATHREHRRRPVRGLIWVVLGVLAGLAMAVPTAEARPRPQGGSAFTANKTFGLGIMVGAPTAIAFKYYLGADTAVDGGVGVIRGFGRDGLHLHVDFLWHPVSLVDTGAFSLPLYLGIGGRVADFDDDPDRYDDDDLNLGVRAPIGIMLDFNTVPLDVFFELALVIDFIGYDGVDADFNGALGVRYYFM
jgi:hypothetical protein